MLELFAKSIVVGIGPLSTAGMIILVLAASIGNRSVAK